MVFKKRTATKTAESAASSGSVKPNLKAEIEDFQLQLETVLTQSMPIDDADLPESLQKGLADIAELIGHADYDPSSTATFYYRVNDDGDKRLYGPSMSAYGGSAGIKWADKFIQVDESESLASEKFQLIPEDNGAYISVDVSGYNFPLGLRIKPEYRKDENFKTKIVTLRTCEALSDYLQRGEPLVKWQEVKDSDKIEFYEVWPVMDRDDKDRVKYGLALGTLNDEPRRFYCPGEWAQWTAIASSGIDPDEPIVLAKKDNCCEWNGVVFELRGSFKKLADLTIGASYKVIGFDKRDSQWGTQVVLKVVDGTSTVMVNGNTYAKQRLLVANPPVITEDKPATLHVDNISETRSGNKKVSIRLVTQSDSSNPLLDKLKAKQAKLAAEQIGDLMPAI